MTRFAGTWRASQPTLHIRCTRTTSDPEYYRIDVGLDVHGRDGRSDRPWDEPDRRPDLRRRRAALRLDPRDNHVKARVSLGHTANDGSIDGAGRVWIPNKIDGTVTRIDPATNTVAETVKVGGQPFVVNSAFGDMWAADNVGPWLFRLHVEGP